MDEGKGVSFIFGLMLGTMVGISVAMLLAPQSGEETREILKEKALEAKKKAREIADNLCDDAEEWVEKGKKYIEETRTGALTKKTSAAADSEVSGVQAPAES